MSHLTFGTLTFLFTDIEGSTWLWEQHPDAMHAALRRHDALLRRVIETHGGSVFKTVGDSVFAAFATAPEGITSAIDAQRELRAEPWREFEEEPHGSGRTQGSPLRVRMALHTGVARSRDSDYFGPALNRASRLLSAGHGGQILLTEATHTLTRHALPDGVVLEDLGEHRLKDLLGPERVYQVLHPELPRQFPPLMTYDVFPPGRVLPAAGRSRGTGVPKSRLARASRHVRARCLWVTHDEAYALLNLVAASAAENSAGEETVLPKLGALCRAFLRAEPVDPQRRGARVATERGN